MRKTVINIKHIGNVIEKNARYETACGRRRFVCEIIGYKPCPAMEMIGDPMCPDKIGLLPCPGFGFKHIQQTTTFRHGSETR